VSKLYKFRRIFTRGQKIKMFILLVGIIVGAQIETLTLAAVQPFVLILTDNTIVYTNSLLNFFYRFFGFGNIESFLALLAVGIALVYTFRGLYVYFFGKLKNRFLARNTAIMSNRLLIQTLKRPYLYHVSSNVAQTQRVVTINSQRLFKLVSAIMEMLVDGFMSLFILLFLMVTSLPMTLVVLFLAAICVVVYFKILRGQITSSGEDEAKGLVMINKSLLQALGGVREIKISQQEQHFSNKFKSITDATIQTQVQVQSIRQLPKLFIESLCFSGAFIVVGIIIVAGIDMETLVPMLGIFMLAAFKLLPAISRFVKNVTTIMRLSGALDQVFADLYEHDDELYALPEEPPITEKTQDVLISSLTFKYPNTKKDVLNNVHLRIPHNKSVGFMGPSGAGKSTLVDIILGVLPPQSGSVIHNGLSVHHHFDQWAKHIGYIPQVIYLLDESIMENVAFGIDKKNIDEEKVWRALEQAQAASFVRDMEDGIKTVVGERGVRLSGGQRQRIGIARALYNNPSILVLDEATSSLDNDTEAAVMDAIRSLQGSKTMIIVAHRLSTIEHCDIVFEVNKKNVKLIRGQI